MCTIHRSAASHGTVHNNGWDAVRRTVHVNQHCPSGCAALARASFHYYVHGANSQCLTSPCLAPCWLPPGRFKGAWLQAAQSCLDVITSTVRGLVEKVVKEELGRFPMALTAVR